MLLPILAILSGFVVLTWGADRFIVGAAGTARNLGLSPLFIGLTVVALGTSAPEMLVSAIAAYNGNPGLAIGNALGSNIANSALVLGTAALVAPLTVRSQSLIREFPVLLAIMALAWFIMLDGSLDVIDGSILVLGVIPLLWWMTVIGRQPGANGNELEQGEPIAQTEAITLTKALSWLVAGSLILLVSSRVVVWGAVEAATLIGVSDTIIGLSIIALGTSLPELAASVVGALRNEHDIAVGNVIGSNMFNLLVVLGLPGLIAPGAFDPEILSRDFPVMAGITVAVMVLCFMRGMPPRLGRTGGLLLVVAFVAYQLVLYDKLP